MKKKIIFTVTNDLSYDQRMIRICGSLSRHGYEVWLLGRRMKNSIPLREEAFRQKRLSCFFYKGFLFYAEYQVRLFLWLLFQRADAVCAVDLDSILPCYFISRLKGWKRIYDAHELFCEMKEVVTRPRIHRIWKRVEKWTVPAFPHAYTVNQPIADEFRRMYGSKFEVIRNLPPLRPPEQVQPEKAYILYQGAVNEGRCFETLIPAMREVNVPLRICGGGNFLEQARKLVNELNLGDRVLFEGTLIPEDLRRITAAARIGITLFENTGLSNYLSLANRFFDYMHAGIPQICVDYPAYREINNQVEIAVLIKDVDAESIARALNRLLTDKELHERLSRNCQKAREIFNWQEEEKKLIRFYHNLMH